MYMNTKFKVISVPFFVESVWKLILPSKGCADSTRRKKFAGASVFDLSSGQTPK